jgi:hypothetical protein
LSTLRHDGHDRNRPFSRLKITQNGLYSHAPSPLLVAHLLEIHRKEMDGCSASVSKMSINNRNLSKVNTHSHPVA